MSTTTRDLLTTKDVAQILGVHVKTVGRLIRTGELAGVNIGTSLRRVYRVDPADLSRYIDACRV